eukprot:Skav208229  [mRNA]  locus=scaffold2601:80703:82422:+ [translate_table: standard]
MPKWVGGKGSVACPTRGQVIEGKVLDSQGRDQGTVFVEVQRLYGNTATGRTFLGNYITATDEYYRYWMSRGEGKSLAVNGSYHLCRGDQAACQRGSGTSGEVVHIGKWRHWTTKELLNGEADHLDGGAANLLTHYLKKSPSEPRARGDLPWSSAKLNIGRGGEAVGLAKEGLDEPAPKKKKAEAAPATKGMGGVNTTELRKQLEALKAQLEEAEKEEAKKTPGKKKTAAPRKDASKKLFPVGKSITKPAERGRHGGDDEDDDGDDEESEEEEKEIEEDEEEEEEKKGSKKKKQKGKEKERRNRGKTDRGPFDLADSLDWDGSDQSDGGKKKADSLDSSSESESFRDAPRSTSHHIRLVRYAKRHPGRLAARLLKKMEQATGFGGGAEVKTQRGGTRPLPVAHIYFLAVMTPSLRDRWTQRSQRELKVSCTLLDLLAEGKGAEAADILGQRVKAIEKSIQDSNQWRRAKYLELVEQEDVALVDQGEENMMAKEADREEKIRGGWNTWRSDWSKGKGKSNYEGAPRNKGSEKGKGKGKKSTPAEKAAGKKEEA